MVGFLDILHLIDSDLDHIRLLTVVFFCMERLHLAFHCILGTLRNPKMDQTFQPRSLIHHRIVGISFRTALAPPLRKYPLLLLEVVVVAAEVFLAADSRQPFNL